MDTKTISTTIRESHVTDFTGVVVRLLSDIKLTTQLEAVFDAFVERTAHCLAQNQIDEFLALGNALETALNRTNLLDNTATSEGSLLPAAYKLSGISRVCQATSHLRVRPSVRDYLDTHPSAVEVLGFLAGEAKRQTELRAFLSKKNKPEVNPNTVRQLLGKLSQLGLIHQPYKRAKYDLSYLGRQVLQQRTKGQPPTLTGLLEQELQKQSRKAVTLDGLTQPVSMDALKPSSCYVWLTSDPGEPLPGHSLVRPEEEFRVLMHPNFKEETATRVGAHILRLTPTLKKKLRFRRAHAFDIASQAHADNGAYCHYVASGLHNTLSKSNFVQAVNFVVRQPLIDTQNPFDELLGVEILWPSSLSFRYSNLMLTHIQETFEAEWEQGHPVGCLRP